MPALRTARPRRWSRRPRASARQPSNDAWFDTMGPRCAPHRDFSASNGRVLTAKSMPRTWAALTVLSRPMPAKTLNSYGFEHPRRADERGSDGQDTPPVSKVLSGTSVRAQNRRGIFSGLRPRSRCATETPPEIISKISLEIIPLEKWGWSIEKIHSKANTEIISQFSPVLMASSVDFAF